MKQHAVPSVSIGLRFVTLVLYSFCSGYAYAQHFTFHHITREDGLEGSYVYDMAQDDQEFIWFATQTGISRYDGTDFKEYDLLHGFKDTGAYRIFKDHNNRLWFISLNYHLYLLEGDRFTHMLPDHLVQWIDEDVNGIKYVVTRKQQFIELDKNNNIHTQTRIDEFPLYLKTLFHSNAALISGTQSVIHVSAKGINKLNMQKNKAVVVRIFELSDSRVLLSDEKGIHLLDANKLTAKNIFPYSANQVLCCYEDTTTKDIWFGTLNGVLRFRTGVIHSSHLEKHLNGYITSIHRTREGLLWFTTLGKGVFYTDTRSLHYTKQDGLTEDAVMHVKKQGDAIYLVPLTCGIL